MSHTRDLIDEALIVIQNYLEKKRKATLYSDKPFHQGTGINKFINKVGVNLTTVTAWKKLIETNYDCWGKLSCLQFYILATNYPQPFDEFYEMLNDDDSKKEYDWYVKYRTAYTFLGERAAYNIFTPRITNEQMEEFSKSIKKTSNGTLKIEGFSIKAPLYDLVHTFLVEQYRLNDLIEPKIGEIVLDIGACFGDTALWFSKYLNEKGKVYAFEPLDYNYMILNENIKRNSVSNIVSIKMGVGDEKRSGTIMGIGGKASVVYEGKGIRVEITTIDDFVDKNDLGHVDFIKMDIEGCELMALKGAEKTIKKFKPKLAICVYHKGDDLITLPKIIKAMDKDYRVYLRNQSSGWAETVLYAMI